MLDWLERPLDPYYPIVYIDCIVVPLRRGSTVSREAIYTLLAVKADQKREVLRIVCHPSESSRGWSDVFGKLKVGRDFSKFGGLSIEVFARCWEKSAIDCILHS